MAKIEVLNPTAEQIAGEAIIASRPWTLDGTVIGLLANGKPYADGFLRMVQEVLSDRYEFKDVVAVNKGNPSRPCPADMIEQLAVEADVVVTASGD